MSAGADSPRPLGRAAIRVLSTARAMWQWDRERLSTTTCLTDSERQTLRMVVRYWCVRYAAVRRSPLRYPQMAMAAIACAVCLFAPAAAVGATAVSSMSVAGLVLAGATYLAVFGTVSAVYFRLILGSSWLYRLGWLGAGACAVAAVVVVLAWVPDPWLALQYGLGAGGIAVLVIVTGSMAAGSFGNLLWFPLRRRALGAVPPHRVAATHLWYILDEFEDAARTWRQPDTRRELLQSVSRRYWLADAIPRAMWFRGYRGPAHAEATRRLRHAAAFVNTLAWRVADCVDQASFDRIRRDLADAAVTVAGGDWTLLLAHDVPPRPSRRRRIIRRLLPSGALATAALLLPYLPGLALTDAQQTTLQAALLVGAVLSLTSADQATRDPILDAFGDPHRRA